MYLDAIECGERVHQRRNFFGINAGVRMLRTRGSYAQHPRTHTYTQTVVADSGTGYPCIVNHAALVSVTDYLLVFWPDTPAHS